MVSRTDQEGDRQNTGRMLGRRRRMTVPGCSTFAREGQLAGCADGICSAGSSTSSGEPHERISAATP